MHLTTSSAISASVIDSTSNPAASLAEAIAGDVSVPTRASTTISPPLVRKAPMRVPPFCGRRPQPSTPTQVVLPGIGRNMWVSPREGHRVTRLALRRRSAGSGWLLWVPLRCLPRRLNSLGSVLDALHPVRNRARVAHPNTDLLSAPETWLVVNTAKTVLGYLDSKLSAQDV